MNSGLRSLKSLSSLRPVTSKCTISFTRNVASAIPKPIQLNRFWKNVNLEDADSGFKIKLDSRPLKTPNGNTLVVPKNKPLLANLIAAEWDAQEKVLKPNSLPLTSLVVRASDDFTHPELREDATTKIMKYLRTDSIFYQQPYPEPLVALQQKHWNPIIKWAQKTFNVDFNVTTGILGVKQPEESLEKMKSWVEQLSNVELACFERATITAKSFLIALALHNRFISAEEAAKAARVEVQSQINVWGEVEDSHDVEREDMRKQLGSVVVGLV
ncbi:hypothetical protein BKA69DRAFT_71704 [Paraphysoderma sedebokerense]|nr:hypothetical protein BKA69DRAFT_71704 [Paraphysoderma sedebokerense]